MREQSAGGETVLLVAPDVAGSPVVASPDRYERLWWDRATGATQYGSLWRPIPPTGYVALGVVWWPGWDEAPALNAVWCVKNEYEGHNYARRPSFAASSQWSDWRTGGNVSDVELWRMIAPPISETDTTERILIPSRNETALLRYGAPELTSLCRSLGLGPCARMLTW
ncbi:Vps62-related protein [Streptomyces tubercidicus]|uniref:Vps62-related protein n=1 Tax=Streptomyces tubercidicus TaxID=47759 RepID=UPI003F5C2EB1